jgi:hypothetical protein
MNHDARKGWILGLLLSIPIVLSAQYQLVLEKPAALKRLRIEEGHILGIQVKGMEEMYFGELKKVKNDLVFMFDDSIAPANITRIFIAKPRTFPNMIRVAALSTIIWYPIIIIGNNVAAHSFTWQKGVQVGSVVVGAAVIQQLMKRFYWRRVNLDKGKWRLKTMPTPESIEVQ